MECKRFKDAANDPLNESIQKRVGRRQIRCGRWKAVCTERSMRRLKVADHLVCVLQATCREEGGVLILTKEQNLVSSKSGSLSSAAIAKLTAFTFGESNRSPNVANPSARSINTERARIFIYRIDEATMTSHFSRRNCEFGSGGNAIAKAKQCLEGKMEISFGRCSVRENPIFRGGQGNPDSQLA